MVDIAEKLAEVAKIEFKKPSLSWAERKADIYSKFKKFKQAFGANVPVVLKEMEEKLK